GSLLPRTTRCWLQRVKARRVFTVRLVMLLLALGFGFVCAEAAYRMWLVAKLHQPPQAQGYDARPTFGVDNPPPWRFDREAAFAYVPDLAWWTAQIGDGEFKVCTPPKVMTNEQGNIGTVVGAWEEGDLRVL